MARKKIKKENIQYNTFTGWLKFLKDREDIKNKVNIHLEGIKKLSTIK